MKKFAVCAVLVLMAAPVFAAKDEREEDRVKEAGTVLKEILNVPDDIPQDLLNKAECVVILPSVKKAAFGVGGSYGRGVMVCRGGAHFTGRWGAPAMFALEGLSIGFQTIKSTWEEIEGRMVLDFLNELWKVQWIGVSASYVRGTRFTGWTAGLDVVFRF